MGRFWFLAMVFSLLGQVRKKAARIEISVCRDLAENAPPFLPKKRLSVLTLNPITCLSIT